MNTKEIAERLVTLCRKGEFEKAQKELYAKDAISIEAHDTPGFDKETKGLDNILEKGHKFQGMVEKLHGLEVSEPTVAGNAISYSLTMDTTMKGRPRSKDSELCVYVVKDGKIVSEQFFN